jgi:hypothetical protein
MLTAFMRSFVGYVAYRYIKVHCLRMPVCASQGVHAMHSQEYEQLVRLARILMAHSRVTFERSNAERLQNLAGEYQRRAAKLDGGELPNIEEYCR